MRSSAAETWLPLSGEKMGQRARTAGMRSASVVVALAVGGLLLGHDRATAQPPPPVRPVMVVDVQVQGNRSVPTEAILNKIDTRPGKEYSKARVEEDIRSLYKLA